MIETKDLIQKLASEARATKPLRKPSYWILQFIFFALFYYVVSQVFLGFRSDIAEKFSQPFFVIEIFLMLLLLLSLLVSTALMLYPDNYQKAYFVKIPEVVLLLLIGFFVVEFFFQSEAELVVASTHNIECSICVALLAIIPAFYFFYILRKGASLDKSRAGAISIAAASLIGCISLRLGEPQDLISHLLIWHYFLVIIFSFIGAALGRVFFKTIS
jgi:hypothetical protein